MVLFFPTNLSDQVNVKGLYNLAHSFLPNRNPGSVLVGVEAGSFQVAQMSANLTGYNASKLAAIKLIQDLGEENRDLHVVSFHPGVGKRSKRLHHYFLNSEEHYLTSTL